MIVVVIVGLLTRDISKGIIIVSHNSIEVRIIPPIALLTQSLLEILWCILGISLIIWLLS